MRFPVRPELTTASAVHGLSLTTTATVDNSAPFSNHPLALIYRGQSVQINRDTSLPRLTHFHVAQDGAITISLKS